jgi:hypothetical protein
LEVVEMDIIISTENRTLTFSPAGSVLISDDHSKFLSAMGFCAVISSKDYSRSWGKDLQWRGNSFPIEKAG